jgi:hypothetical protein
MIQYSEALVMESRSRGVLDTPPEPVIGLAEGETRWRGMTTVEQRCRADVAQTNVTATLPSPANSITTASPALSHAVLTRLPVKTISPARRPLPSAAR